MQSTVSDFFTHFVFFPAFLQFLIRDARGIGEVFSHGLAVDSFILNHVLVGVLVFVAGFYLLVNSQGLFSPSLMVMGLMLNIFLVSPLSVPP